MKSLRKIPKIIVADIGGTHIACGVYDVCNSQVLESSYVRKAIDSRGEKEDILLGFVTCIAEAAQLASVRVEALSIAMPGPFDYSKGISLIKGFAKYDSLYGTDIKAYLADKLKIDPENIEFRNDAEALICGELIMLDHINSDDILGVTLGTGFGSAICKEGEISDMGLGALPFEGKKADEYFSTRWFVSEYFQKTGKIFIGVKELISEGDPVIVAKVFSRFAKNLSSFLKPIIDRLGINQLLICGNIAKSYPLFLPQLQDYIPNIRISIGQFGEIAALVGAAENFVSRFDAPSNNLNVE